VETKYQCRERRGIHLLTLSDLVILVLTGLGVVLVIPALGESSLLDEMLLALSRRSDKISTDVKWADKR